MIYFTSDTHFYHKAIIGYCERPWVDVDAMNEGMIERWNLKVGPLDTVYHLGDFAFAGKEKTKAVFDRLNGFKVLIKGNHDNYKTHRDLGWQGMYDYLEQKLNVTYEDDDGGMAQYEAKVIMMHFPITSWNGMSHGSWMLHGHCHGSLPYAGGLILDVGVDPNNWFPLSIQEVKDIMIKRQIRRVDHH